LSTDSVNNVSRAPDDESPRIDLQKIVASVLLAILVIGGLAFYINRPAQKVEDLSKLVQQMRPWCSQHHFGDRTIDTSRASLVALAQSDAPRWEVASDSAVASCAQSSQPATKLFVLTFPSSNSENLWLSKDDGGQYYIVGDSTPLPVFVGLGWVAVLGTNSRQEDRDIATLSKVFKVDYRFSDFSSVSW
jgi:hypothetical protein